MIPKAIVGIKSLLSCEELQPASNSSLNEIFILNLDSFVLRATLTTLGYTKFPKTFFCSQYVNKCGPHFYVEKKIDQKGTK